MESNEVTKTIDQLRNEIEELRSRLTESEETLNAIRNGEVDAIVVSGKDGDKIFSLASSETPYRIILEEMDEGAVIAKADGTILFYNKRFESLTAGNNRLIEGSKITDFFSGDQKPVLTRLLKKGMTGRSTGVISSASELCDSTLFFNLSIRALPPSVAGDLCIIISDITKMQEYQVHLEELINTATLDLIRANDKLEKTQQRLNNALDNGDIGTWEWDLKTDEIILDERNDRILGVEKDTFDNTLQAFENLVNEEDLNHVRKAISTTVEKGTPLETIFRLRSDNRFISSKASLTRDNNGLPVKLVGVCFDVSGLKRSSERILLKLSEELLRSNKELENFAYVTSHDLQEPLRMVSSFTQLLEKQYNDKLDESAREYIHYAVEGANRMYELLNGLLAYSRIHSKGKAFVNVDLNHIVDSVTKNLSLIIQERNAIINSKKLPQVFADDSQMILLFQNLISNSIKFSTGSPKIYISSKSENDHYILSVRDEGLGIEPQYFERVFQIFQRLMPKSEYEGTGIGLAICKRIVDRHDGKIWIESEPGKGSTFFFTIPKNNK